MDNLKVFCASFKVTYHKGVPMPHKSFSWLSTHHQNKLLFEGETNLKLLQMEVIAFKTGLQVEYDALLKTVQKAGKKVQSWNYQKHDWPQAVHTYTVRAYGETWSHDALLVILFYHLPLIRLQFFPTLVFFTNLAVEIDEEEEEVVVLVHVRATHYLFVVFTHKVVDGFNSGETGGWKTFLTSPELSLMASHFHPAQIYRTTYVYKSDPCIKPKRECL